MQKINEKTVTFSFIALLFLASISAGMAVAILMLLGRFSIEYIAICAIVAIIAENLILIPLYANLVGKYKSSDSSQNTAKTTKAAPRAQRAPRTPRKRTTKATAKARGQG